MPPELKKALEKINFDAKHIGFFDLIHDFLFILDSEGSILKVNKTVTERMGFSKDDLYYKPILVLYPPERQKEAAKIVSKMLNGETDSCNVPIITKDGKLIHVETKIAKGRLNNQDIIIGISRDITERKKAEEALLREKKFTETALNTQMDTFFVFDPSTGIPLRWNKAFSYISGYSDEEISQLKAPENYYNEKDLLKLSEAIKLIEKGDTAVLEVYLKTKDGNFIPFEYSASGIFDEKNNLKYIVAVGRNTSERKVAGTKVLESEEKYRNLFEKSPNAIVLLDFTGKIIECNSTTEKVFGYPVEELVGHNYLELPFYSERMINTLKERFRAITEKSDLEPQELEIKKKDGSIAIIKNKISFIKIGEKDFFQAIIQDITEQITTENKLKESEENFRTITEESHLAITILQDDHVVYANQKMADLFGYDREEMLNWSPKEYAKTIAEDSLDFVMEQARKKQNGAPDVITNYPIHCIKNTGEKFWVDNISTTITYNGRPADLVTIIDMTEKHEAEKKLKESEEKFRSIAEHSAIGIFILQDNVFKFINNKALEEMGYSYEEVMNWTIDDILKTAHPEDRDFIREQGIKKQRGDRDVVEEYEARFINKNNRIIWVKNLSKTIMYNGRPAVLISHVYINDMKEAELKLRESEEKFRNLSDQSLMGIIIAQDNKIKYVNQAYADIFGYSVEEMINWELKDAINAIYEDDRDFALQQLLKKQKGDSEVMNHYSYRGVRKSGEIIWIENYSKTILYEGCPADLVVQIDITDKIKAEEKLKESELKFRRIFEAIPDLYFLVSGDTTILDHKGTEEELYISPESFMGKKLSNTMPFDLGKKSLITVKKVIETREPQVFEYNLDFKNRISTFEARFLYLSDDRVLILVRDITERKLADEKLKNSEEKYRNLFNTAPFGIAVFSLEGDIIDINNALLKIIGFSREDVIGKHYMEVQLFPEMDSLNFEGRENQIRNGNLPKPRELLIENKFGRKIWISSQLSFVQLGEKIFIQAIIHDITERKVAEEELKASEDNYRKAYDRVNFYKDLFAHDLNNVLQSILSSVELHSLIDKDPENSKNIEYLLKIINDSALRGAKLISNVQKLSNLEDSKLITQELNLCNFLKEAINFTKIKYQKKEISIQIEGKFKIINVHANELLLDVFENILINAVKYNESERIEILIRISEIDQNNIPHIKLEFIDNGMGVEDSRKDKIFEVGNREFKGGRGMGMGLSLVKKTIDSYGGKIYLEDKVKGDFSKGSNFILIIRKA